MTPISKELQEEIKEKAETWANKGAYEQYRGGQRSATVFGQSKQDYIAGATAYAHYKERFDQAKKALEQIIQVPENLNDGYEDRANRMEFIAAKALASWKEEGMEGKEGKPDE